jgi:hypothetical protein
MRSLLGSVFGFLKREWFLLLAVGVAALIIYLFEIL